MLAYVQTGSSKTYTMGTSCNDSDEMGIIPRAINDIFNHVEDNFSYDFTINVTFMELYQETLYDLLSKKPQDQCSVEIREDGKNISIPDLTEKPMDSTSKALHYLKLGSSFCTFGPTNMNAESSRSHAISTINICMQKKVIKIKVQNFIWLIWRVQREQRKLESPDRPSKRVLTSLGDDKLRGGSFHTETVI